MLILFLRIKGNSFGCGFPGPLTLLKKKQEVFKFLLLPVACANTFSGIHPLRIEQSSWKMFLVMEVKGWSALGARFVKFLIKEEK